MKIRPFKLERYFAKYEFSAPYLLSCSDCEPLDLKELLGYADKKSLSLWQELSLGYTESQGLPALRVEISKLYKNIKAEDVVVLAPEEGIFIALNVLLEKNDHVVVTSPGYQSLFEVADSIGCKVSRWEWNENKFDINNLKKLIKKETKLLIINFPHNPTGYLPSRKEYFEIIDLVKEKGIFIFSDEMYRLSEHKTEFRLNSVCDIYDNAISLFGMSKTFGLAGLRIGWLATRNKNVLDKIRYFKDFTTICNSAPSEVFALIALRQKDKIIERNLKIINSNLKILDNFFDKYKKIFCYSKPKAGTIAFPELLKNINIEDFCKDLVQKKGVMLLPDSVYDFNKNHFRIGFGRKNMPKALSLLEEYIFENNL